MGNSIATMHNPSSLGSKYYIYLKNKPIFLYNLFIKPKSVDEDIRRREFILNIILTGTIILILWSNLIVFFSHITNQNGGDYLDLVPFSFLTVIFLLLFLGSRLGKIKLVSYFLVILYLIATSYGAFRWGIILPAVMLSYALLITITSVLLGSRIGLIMTGLCILALFIFGYEEAVLNIIPQWRYNPLTSADLTEYAIILAVISLVSWLSTKEIEKSLSRARQSENDLRAERDSLEITIKERTKELEATQSEKMSQLYRFAEFGRLSSGLFHDLINPLTSVVLNLGNIKESVHPDVRIVKEDLNRAVVASERMNELIDTVTNQIRTDAPATIFDLEKSIRETIKLFSHRSNLIRVPLVFLQCPKSQLFGNKLKFNQIMTNLISNALDSYGQSNNQKSNRSIEIKVTNKNNFINIFIIDKGKGIPKELLPQIFDPFFSTKPSSQGMGLGLSIVKSIITHEFKGQIKAESNLGTGTIFTLTFPGNYSSLR